MRAVARVHRGEAARPGAAHETQQERLGLIVARVAERHDVGAEVRARALEERVARGSRRVLERARARAGARGDVLAIDEKRPVERCRQVAAEALVAVRPSREAGD